MNTFPIPNKVLYRFQMKTAPYRLWTKVVLVLLTLLPVAFAEVTVFPAPDGTEASKIWQVTVEDRAVFCYADYRLNADFPPTLHKMRVSPQAYALFDFSDTVTVRATFLGNTPEKLDTLVIRPQAQGITPRIHGRTVEFDLDRPCDITLDPDGTGLYVLHLFTNRPETDIPDPNDPTVIYFGPGVHDIEELELAAGQTLYLAGGAVLRPCPSRLRKPAKERHYTGIEYALMEAGIRAHGDNVTVRGRGIISGERGLSAGRRFCLFHGQRMAHLHIQDVLFTRSNSWTLLMYDCRDSVIDHIRILGYFTNSDGVCLHSCRNCRVADCFIHTADDCYEVKAKANNILFENSQVWCDAGTAMGVTHEIDGLVTDVTWRNMTVLHYTYAFNPYEGITSRGAIFVHPAMGGTVDGLRFEQITIENTTTDRPIICLYNVKKPKEGSHFFPEKPYSAIHNVSFRKIRAKDVQNQEIFLYDESQAGLINNITFEDVVINGTPLQKGDTRFNLRGAVTGIEVE